MIPLNTALNFLRGHGIDPEADIEAVRRIAVARITGDDSSAIIGAWDAEQPVDVLEPLARQDSPEIIRRAVCDGWKDVCAEVLSVLLKSTAPLGENVVRRIDALTRLAELAHPEELRDEVRVMLSLATLESNMGRMDADEAFGSAVYRVLSAWRSYQPREAADIELAERLIKKERFAAAAFRVLVECDPQHNRVIEHLRDLFIKQYGASGWRIDSVHLALVQAGAVQDGYSAIIHLLKGLGKSNPDIWPGIEVDLKRRADRGKAWAKEWMNGVTLTRHTAWLSSLMRDTVKFAAVSPTIRWLPENPVTRDESNIQSDLVSSDAPFRALIQKGAGLFVYKPGLPAGRWAL